MIHLGVKKVENERKDAIKNQVSKIYSGRRSTPPLSPDKTCNCS